MLDMRIMKSTQVIMAFVMTAGLFFVIANTTSTFAATCDLKAINSQVTHGLEIAEKGHFADSKLLAKAAAEYWFAAEKFKVCISAVGGEEPVTSSLVLARTIAMAQSVLLFNMSGMPHTKTDPMFHLLKADLTHLMASPDLLTSQRQQAAVMLEMLHKQYVPQ